MTLSSRRFLILALTSALLGLAALPASAQLGGLPPAVVSGTNLTEAQREQVRQYVETHKADLGNADPLVMKRGRAALEEPLSNPAVSIAFRIEYGKHLLPVLEPLVSRKEDVFAANAMHLAGELATPLAADLLTITGLADKRPPVRHAAAFGLKRTFEHLQQTSPVFRESDAVKVIDAISRRIATETEPFVLEGFTRAFEAATLVSDARVKGLRAAASLALAKAMGDYVRANRGDLGGAGAMIRAAQVLRDAVNGQGLPANEPQLVAATLREIAGFGGDLIAAVKCRLEDAGAGEPDRDRLAALAASGENVYYFAHSALGGATPLNLQLAPQVRGGRDREFAQAAEQYIGKTGILTAQPFGLLPKRFECGAPAAAPAAAAPR